MANEKYKTTFSENCRYYLGFANSNLAETIRLRKIANQLSIIKENKEGCSDIELVNYAHIVDGMYYGILSFHKDPQGDIQGYNVHDYISDKAYIATSWGTLNDDTTPQRKALENNIKFFKLPWYNKISTLCQLVGRAFFEKPVLNAVLAWILIGVLLYLEASWLSFTPVSTILLASTLVLSTLAISLLKRIGFISMIRQVEDPGNSALKTLWQQGLRSATGLNIVLVTSLLCSAGLFMAATLNKLLYSMFITGSAISFLPFATTPWACFMFFSVCFAVLYGLNTQHMKHAFSDRPTSTANAFTIEINGITFTDQSFFKMICRVISSTVTNSVSLVGRAVQDAFGTVKQNPETRCLFMDMGSALAVPAGELASQSSRALASSFSTEISVGQNAASASQSSNG